ncbi:MAG: ankyrin repeat protein [Rickettsiaceae bacterium]|jgi:hypothetical protein|nr:ankyrin repeat protein [Rickettsiaceae bacterium]
MTQDELRRQIIDLIAKNNPEDLELIKAKILELEDINVDITLNRNSLSGGAPWTEISDISSQICVYNNIELAKYILSLNNLNINKICSYGSSYLGKALEVKMNFKEGNPPFYFIYDFSIAEELIEHGADINNIDSYGSSALMHLNKNFNNDEFEFLINHGVNINKKDNFGIDTLSYFALNNYSLGVEKLLAIGAYANITDNSGATALHWSALLENFKHKYSSRKITKIFLRNGFDVLQVVKSKSTTIVDYGTRQEEGYDIGEAPIKYIPLKWIIEQLNGGGSLNPIYQLELYRGLKFYENKGEIQKLEVEEYYPSHNGNDFTKGCFSELQEKLIHLKADNKISRNIIDSVVKNATNLTNQLFDTEFDEHINLGDFQYMAYKFMQEVSYKVREKKAEFYSNWHYFLGLCKDKDFLGNLKFLPQDIVKYIISLSLEGNSTDCSQGFVAGKTFHELHLIENSLGEFENTLSGLISSEYNTTPD